MIVGGISNIESFIMKRFQNLSWLLLGYTLLVILWGAWVRISHSGDGCGNSWPLCEGQFIPLKPDIETSGKTWVEFSHRLTSGLYGLLVLGFWLWSKRIFPKDHPARKAAFFAFIFMVIEALFGAVLVRQGLVGQNESMARVVLMSLHFLNSALLVFTTALMADFSSHSNWQSREPFTKGVFKHLPKISLLLLAALGLTGTFAALSTTLFPSLSLGESLSKEMAPDAHFLLQLRTLHPVLGVFAGSSLALLILLSPEATLRSINEFRKSSYRLGGALLVTITLGAITLLTLSPVTLKILHLALAHLTIIFLALWIRTIRFEPKSTALKP